MRGLTKYIDLFSKCGLFSGIPETELVPVLELFRAKQKHFAKNEYILHIGDMFRYAGNVLEGTVEGSFQNDNADKINIRHFRTGDLFGEALACLEEMESPIQLRAATECEVLFLELRSVYRRDCVVKEEYFRPLSVNLIQILAKRNLFQNQRIRVLGQKKLREQILHFIASLPRKNDGSTELPFTITTIAEYLGVNRSSLSREIGQMMDDGIISMDGRKIRILSWSEA